MKFISRSKFFNRYLPLGLSVIILVTGTLFWYTFHKPKVAQASWYNSSWQYRKLVTLNHNKVSGGADLTNFPVLISRTDGDFAYTSNGGRVGKSDGTDILFTSSDGTTKLDHEIEKFVAATGEVEAWVRIPTLSASADTLIYMYYGNAGAADQQNKTGVWDSNYKGVWHVGDGTTLSTSDSTTNANNLTNTSVTATTGQIDGAANFSSANLANATASGATGTVWTIEMWVNPTGAGQYTFFSGASTNGSIGFREIASRLDASRENVAGASADSSGTLAAGQWNHVAMSFDGTTIKYYIAGSASGTATLGSATITNSIKFGNSQNYAEAYAGKMDEMKISMVVRTAGWIGTEYNNQFDPGTFAGFGSNELNTGVLTGWYDSAWGYRIQLNLNHSQVSGGADLTNFPVLVSRLDNNWKTVANGGFMGKPDATDIVFTSADGLTKLDYEIEKYVATTGELEAWVRIPTLTFAADTVIYMYYGNSGAADQQNKTGVWNSNYKSVSHLPDGTTLSAADSTSNANNGTKNSTGGSITPIAGKIDGAASFAAANSQYIIGANTLNLATVTVSGWVNVAAYPGSNIGLVAGFANGIGSGVHDKDLGITAAGKANWYISDGGVKTVTGATTLTTSAWHYIVGTADGTTSRLYVDGVADGSLAAGNSYASYTVPNNFIAGATGSASLGGTYMDAKIDEVRISDLARSAGWITTEYNNQSAPSTFVTYGNQISVPVNVTGRWYNSAWGYRKRIVIDHTKVSGSTNLVNFPALISATDTDFKATASGGNVGLTTGLDILFTRSDGITKLNHEIEKYVSTTGEVEAWVQIPSLSPYGDVVIYMYYGNSGASDQQNKTAVWDSNYKGVWHVGNGTTLSTADSTSNANNLTNTSVTATTGQIDGAANFSSANLATGTGTGMSGSTWTLEMWVNPNSTTQYTFFSGAIGGTGGIGLRQNTSAHLFASKETIADANATSTGALTTSAWNSIVLTSDGSTLKYYIAGAPSGTATLAGATITGSIKFGDSQSYSEPYAGKMDELKISMVIRSADWIATEYNNQNAPSTFVTWGTQASAPVVPGWSSASWGYRKQIVVDHTKVSGTANLSNFPMLYSAIDPDLASTANNGFVGKSDGTDIFFTSQDGTTKLNHELEKYVATTGEVVAWVKIPTLSPKNDTILYMYYGNAGAADQQNKTAVWDSNYKSVSHLSDGTTLSAADSTSNANNGTTHSTSGSITPAAGQIDGAASFLGANSQYISGTNTLNIGQVTLSGWVYITGYPAGGNVGQIAGFANGNGSGTHDKDMGITNTGKISWYIWDGAAKTVTGATTISLNAWHYVVATVDGATSRVYLDGVADGSLAAGNSYTSYTVPDTFINGLDANVAIGTYMDGTLDEIRISDMARSADWIATEYNNQRAPGQFYSVGQSSISSGVASWYNASWSYRKQIVINRGQVSGTSDLVNFPALVSLTNAELKSTGNGGNVGLSTGLDILFTKADGTTKLNHEVEKYVATTGELEAWVKIPALSPTSNTVLYMYYGNAGAADQQNKTAVYDSNYKGVWHVGDGTTLSTADSTSNANTLTNTSVTATTGQIDGAANFSSANLATGTATGMSGSVWTIEMWVNPNGTSNATLFSGATGSGGVGFRELGSFLSASRENIIDATAASKTTLTSGVWNHVAVTDDGTNLKYYIAGAPSGTATLSNAILSSSIEFGNSQGYSEPYAGKMDEMKVSNVVRSGDWIATEYNNQSSPATFMLFAGQEAFSRAASVPDQKARGGVNIKGGNVKFR